MKGNFLLASMLTSVLLFTGCSNNTSTNKDEKEKKSAEKHEVNYNDQESWEFESGDSQSPIAIKSSIAEKMKDKGTIDLNYNDKVLDEVDNGHSIQVNVSGAAMINGRSFYLTQYHFHAPSEHTLDGEHYPIEAHFVNEAQDGRLAVIGVFFTEGAENQGFKKVIENIKKGDKNTAVGEISIGSMIPVNKSYFHYLGSLTTPPLSENVEWYVMKNPIEVSKEQIQAFQKHYNDNNRDLQPLKDRKILKYEE